ETASWWARNYYNQRYGMDNAKQNEIFGNPPCGGEYAFQRQTLYVGNNDNLLLPKINEYFVRQSVNATIGVGYVMVPLFTSEEALFNRVEANIYLNNTSAALADLNIYASTRIYNYDPNKNTMTAASLNAIYRTNNFQANLFNAMIEFKRAEFAQEGMRWFDLLRYKVPVIHTTSDGKTLTLTGTD